MFLLETASSRERTEGRPSVDAADFLNLPASCSHLPRLSRHRLRRACCYRGHFPSFVSSQASVHRRCLAFLRQFFECRL